MVALISYLNVLLAIYKHFNYQCILFLYHEINSEIKLEIVHLSKQLMVRQISIWTRPMEFPTQINRHLKYNQCFRPLIIGLENSNNTIVLDKVLEDDLCHPRLKWVYIARNDDNISVDFDVQVPKCINYLKLNFNSNNSIILEESVPSDTKPLIWDSYNEFSRQFSLNAYSISFGGWFANNKGIMNFKFNSPIRYFFLWMNQKINILHQQSYIFTSYTEVQDAFEAELTDLTLISLTMGKDQLNFSKLTFPNDFIAGRVYLAKITTLRIGWNMYFKPLSFHVWIYLVIFLSLNSIILTLVYRKLCVGNLNFLTCFTIWCSFCSRAFPETPKSFSQKLLLITFHLTFYILWASYNALLFSYFSIQFTDKPIETPQQLEDSSYQLGSTNYDYESIKTQFKNLKNRVELFNYNEMSIAFTRMCKEKYGILTTLSKRLYYDAYEEAECDFYSLDMGLKYYVSFALKHDTPLDDLANQCLCAVREYGNFLNKQPNRKIFHRDSFDGIHIEITTPLFSMLMIMGSISLIILIVEIYWYNHYNKKSGVKH